LFLSAAKALGVEVFWERYIQRPENLIYLLKQDKVFLIILGLVLLYEVYFRIRRRA
jgi:hypothetical protein